MLTRKAYTLVQMAVILVVIGLIMSFTIKGKSIIDNSKFLKESSILNKLDANMLSYIELHNNTLDFLDNGFRLDTTEFKKHYALSNSDFESLLYPNLFYTPAIADNINHTSCKNNCGLIAQNKGLWNNPVIIWALDSSPNGKENKPLTIGFGLYCFLEKTRDDQNAISGNIRMWDISKSTADNYNFKNCMEQNDNVADIAYAGFISLADANWLY